LAGAFITAVVTGIAGHVVDALFSNNSPSPRATPQADVTSVRLVRPFDLSGKLLGNFKEAGHPTGYCIDGYESSDPEALRCFTADSQMFDPCWAYGDRAACPSSPWGGEVWIIGLERPPANQPDLGGGEGADGEENSRCRVQQGDQSSRRHKPNQSQSKRDCPARQGLAW
jgi:hypothetical protein